MLLLLSLRSSPHLKSNNIILRHVALSYEVVCALVDAVYERREGFGGRVTLG